ncbi:MAG: M48 family metalloprotease [Alphaproteobacteria bacterium]|nr:M48 family metalloprotease [Alphaproteobacteria bacterium]
MILSRTPFQGRILTSLAVAATAIAAAMLAAIAPAHAGSGIRDAEMERILRAYGEPIWRAAGLDPQAIHVYIINDPSINAFVAGGQNIFMNTGTIMELDTPGELKGIIAHETGHIAGGHLARGPEAMSKAEVPMIISMIAGVAAIAAGAPDIGMAMMVGAQGVAQRELLAFSRQQEASADQAGVKYLTATGQSARGMLEVFNKFADQEALTGVRQDPFVRSHPLSRDRMAALERLVMASPYRDKPDSKAELEAYAMMRAKLRGFIDSPEVTLRLYPESDKSQPARYARAVAYFKGADLETALAQINSLIAERPNYPFFWELKGQILVESAKPAEGVPAYRKAVELAPDEPLLQASLGAALVATEDPKLLAEAKTHLKAALNLEPDNAMAWYYLASVYDSQGNEGMAALATAERDFAVQDMGGAMRFAKRAQRGLRQGTQDWQRATDIVAVSQAQMPAQRSGRHLAPHITFSGSRLN